MLVCQCNGISDRKIRKAVRKGAENASQVSRMCGAGSTCGGCIPTIREIVRDEVRERDETPAAATQVVAIATNL